MKTSNDLEIKSLLEQHRNLSECILEQINWIDFGVTIELVFNYVWTNDARIRPNLQIPEILIMRFRLVQEMHITNALNDAMCVDPEQVNWGLNEVSLAELVQESSSLRTYNSLPVPFHHLALLFAGDRRIDIIFSELEVLRE